MVIEEYARRFKKKTNNKITLYHLITHTSGIVEISLRNYSGNLFATIFRTNKGKVFPPRYSYDTSTFLTEVSQIKLKNNPGVTFRYSNTGIGLVGKILERITNSTYDKLIKEKVCNTLEMNDTGITISETQKERLAMGYLYTGKEAEPISIPSVASAGSVSDLDDIRIVWHSGGTEGSLLL